MEFYGRSTGRDGSESGWPVGSETGLEESMQRFGLWSRELPYPERSGVPDCAFYMRTGSCGYGSKCRYNHPRDRSSVGATVRFGRGEYPERPGELTCQYYSRTGICKFGASCKFHHPRNGGGSMSNMRVNIYGYPLRPGERECSYYLKTGQCKFGVACKFDHPQPGGMSMPEPAHQFYPTVQSSSSVPSFDPYGAASPSYRTGRPPPLPGSYVPGAYGPVLLSPGVVPISGWSPYAGPVSPVLSPSAPHSVGAGSPYGVTQLPSSASAFVGPYPTFPSPAGPSSSTQERGFPERPGQPDCQYYLKTGDCKFGSSCRFHHPPDWVVSKTNCLLSSMGLPMRPGVQPCAFYMQNGHCKFGSTCRFDHPIRTVRYSPSASSLSDMLVAPYLVGSSLATLAPPFSNSEPRPEFISGPILDPPHSSRIPSSGNTSSSSVGFIYSQTGSASLSDVQQSSQSSAPLSISTSTRQGSTLASISTQITKLKWQTPLWKCFPLINNNKVVISIRRVHFGLLILRAYVETFLKASQILGHFIAVSNWDMERSLFVTHCIDSPAAEQRLPIGRTTPPVTFGPSSFVNQARPCVVPTSELTEPLLFSSLLSGIGMPLSFSKLGNSLPFSRLFRRLEQEMETVIKVLEPGPLGVVEHKFSAEEICEANATVSRAVENWRRNAKLEQNSNVLKDYIHK
ncbi:unnamed protein product [Camellia sinensis]